MSKDSDLTGIRAYFKHPGIQLTHLCCLLETSYLCRPSSTDIGRTRRVIIAATCVLYFASTAILLYGSWNAFNTASAGIIAVLLWIPSGLGLLMLLLFGAGRIMMGHRRQ